MLSRKRTHFTFGAFTVNYTSLRAQDGKIMAAAI